MANPLISILVSWFVLGFLWASLYDTINTTLPNMAPIALSESGGTWNILLWIWNAGIVILALATAIASFKGRTTAGIVSAVEVFTCWTLLIFIWIVLYTPINSTIPNALNAWAHAMNPAYVAPTYLLGYYNNGAIILMVGLGVVILGRNT